MAKLKRPPSKEIPTRKPSTLPEPEGDSFAPFITAKELTKPMKAVIESLSMRRTQYSDGVLNVEVNGKTRAIGIRFESPNYRILYEEFGDNADKWKGGKITLAKRYSKNWKKEVLVIEV